MRYTEARLEKITQEVYLSDMDKNVVDFMPNFDETEKEPVVLPVRVPNLLLNGADGIAVGMATSIPPHNLAEIVDGVKAYMKNNEISVKGLMRYIKGPDFPTGGIVINKDELLKIYETGSGKIKMAKSFSVSPEVNLIGMTTDEAMPVLDKYLDDAYLAHLPQVRVVHGRGTGALRAAVHKHLKKLKYVKEFRLGEFGEGDTGVTIVTFK